MTHRNLPRSSHGPATAEAPLSPPTCRLSDLTHQSQLTASAPLLVHFGTFGAVLEHAEAPFHLNAAE